VGKCLVLKVDVVNNCLKRQGVDWGTVLEKGKKVKLHIFPSVRQGGTRTNENNIRGCPR
jgi:hypothetical protein